MKKKNCFNCGAPAMSCVGILPLCSSCVTLTKNVRGVSFQQDAVAPAKPK